MAKLNLTEIHTARLLKLALILTLHQEPTKKRGTEFDMGVWGYHDGRHKPGVKDNFCGTAACALGHAAMDKEFRADGLKLTFTKIDKEDGGGWKGDVSFHGEHGENAGAAFFGLTSDEARVFLNSDALKHDVARELARLAIYREEVSNT